MTLMVPMSPAACTWVPPQSSMELPTSSTRTTSPYLSPKKAMAPSAVGFVLGGLERAGRRVGQRLGVGDLLDPADLVGGDGRVVREVEAQAIGADQRAGLLDVLAEHLAQRVVEDVRAGVVAADGDAALDVDGRRGRGAGHDAAAR